MPQAFFKRMREMQKSEAPAQTERKYGFHDRLKTATSIGC
jgi:hypothetical protein